MTPAGGAFDRSAEVAAGQRGTLRQDFEQFFERHRHTVGDPLHFLGRAGNLMRYAEFLDIVLGRYIAVAEARHAAHTALQASLAPGHNVLSPAQQQLVATMQGTGPAMHLDIESFYLFAKILLDRWSQFLPYWFGGPRGVKLHSHDNLVKNIDAFTEPKACPGSPVTSESGCKQC